MSKLDKKLNSICFLVIAIIILLVLVVFIYCPSEWTMSDRLLIITVLIIFVVLISGIGSLVCISNHMLEADSMVNNEF